MRHVLEYQVGGQKVLGIWDTDMGKGRLLWLDGKAYDLISPRDQLMIDRIRQTGVPDETPQEPEEPCQLSLF